MLDQKKTQTMSLHVTDDLTVTILPNSNHEFLMTTKEVSTGYGIAEATLRTHKHRYKEELLENVHWITGVTNRNGNSFPATYVMWTKAGVIRLGLFIRSERAKLFRDWVENLVLKFTEPKLVALPETPKRKHNRLTAERLLDIMSEVVKIEDAELRLSISRKIMEG